MTVLDVPALSLNPSSLSQRHPGIYEHAQCILVRALCIYRCLYVVMHYISSTIESLPTARWKGAFDAVSPVRLELTKFSVVAKPPVACSTLFYFMLRPECWASLNTYLSYDSNLRASL